MKKADSALLMAAWNQQQSDQEIASGCRCSVATVCRWRRSLELSPNTKVSQLTAAQQQTVLSLAAQGIPLRAIAEQTAIFVETIRKLLLRRRVPYQKSESRTIAKEVHGTLGYGGYVELRVARDGPYGNLIKHGGPATGYALLHRMRMQDVVGRPLLSSEVVHHVDGDIYNNSVANLRLFQSHADHLKHHAETGLARCKEASDRW